MPRPYVPPPSRMERKRREREWLEDSEKRHSREKHKPRGNWTNPDNRDIFDKALDYAPIVGTAIGARVGFKRKMPRGMTPEDGPEVMRTMQSIVGGLGGFGGGVVAKAALSKDYGNGKGPKRYKGAGKPRK